MLKIKKYIEIILEIVISIAKKSNKIKNFCRFIYIDQYENWMLLPFKLVHNLLSYSINKCMLCKNNNK